MSSYGAGENRPEPADFQPRSVLIPSLVLIGSQLPLSLIYLVNLYRDRDHYLYFPVALLATLLLVAMRWPRGDQKAFFPGKLAGVLTAAGVALAVPATIFLSPWFSFASLVSFAGALFARTNDRYRFGSLAILMLPLLVLLQPPAGVDFDTVQGDIQLMTAINGWATTLASHFSDLIGAGLNMINVNLPAGSRIIVPHGAVDTADIGTGGASVFTLMMAIAVYAAATRRPLLRGLALIVLCVFWAAVGEALHAVICIVGAGTFEMDWLDNHEPQWLRWTTFLFSFLMSILSDSVLRFVCGPVEMTTIDEDNRIQYWLCRTWNHAVSGAESPDIDKNVRREVAWLQWRTSVPGPGSVRRLWIASMVCLILSAFQIVELGRASSLAGQHGLQESHSRWVPLSPDVLPESLVGLVKSAHSEIEPQRRTPYRVYMNSFSWSRPDQPQWTYELTVSQIWPGWHDPVVDQMRYEWSVVGGELVTGRAIVPEPIPLFPMFEVRLANTSAEEKYLAWCQFDAFGEPFEPPLTWTDPADFFRRAWQRLGYRIRPRLFVPGAVLAEISVTTVGPVPPEARGQAVELLAAAVKHVHDQLLRNELPRGNPDAPLPPSDSPESVPEVSPAE